MAKNGAFHEIIYPHLFQSVSYFLQLKLMDNGFYLFHGCLRVQMLALHKFFELPEFYFYRYRAKLL